MELSRFDGQLISTVLEDAGRIYLDLLDLTQDLVAVVDRDYRYVAVNPAHARAHGQDPNDIIGRTVADVMGADVFQHVLRSHYDRAMHGEAVRFSGWFDFVALDRRYCTVAFKPRVDADGAIIGVVLLVRDQTEQHLIADSLRRSQGRLELALASARMGIWEWDITANTWAGAAAGAADARAGRWPARCLGRGRRLGSGCAGQPADRRRLHRHRVCIRGRSG